MARGGNIFWRCDRARRAHVRFGAIAASTASLLLNLEAVFTALFAWFLFRENFDRRVMFGMLAIVAGGLLLAWAPGELGGASSGAVLVAVACICWALDNNLTRKVSASDAVPIAGLKGLVGPPSISASRCFRSTYCRRCARSRRRGGISRLRRQPRLVCGCASRSWNCTGGSLFLGGPILRCRVCSVVAGRNSILAPSPRRGSDGSGRLAAPHRTPRAPACARAVTTHSTPTAHDEHHRHAHDFAWDGREPHTHPTVHMPLIHAHAHYPERASPSPPLDAAARPRRSPAAGLAGHGRQIALGKGRRNSIAPQRGR